MFFDGIFIQRPGQHTPLDLMFGVIAIAMVLAEAGIQVAPLLAGLALAAAN